MKDAAVSPVVAFMLLLMIVVSFISVLNAYYIPSLKQQAEIQHLHSVEESFSKISSDILQVLSFRQNMTTRETIILGGGDTILSPIRSSGYLEVNTTLQDEPLSKIKITIGTNVYESLLNRLRIQYRPVGNFWVNQGYEWEDGVLNISKGNRKTSLEYTDNSDKMSGDEQEKYYCMFAPRIDLNTIPPTIKIDLIQNTNSERNRSISSNGIGTVWIDMKECSRNTIALTENNKVSFSFSGTDEDAIGFKSSINQTFSQWSNFNQSIWDCTSDTLTVFQNSQNETPNLTVVIWNLSVIVG